MGRAVQHVLLRQVVEPHDADLSQTLHDSSALKPYTVSGLMRPDQNAPLYGNVNQGDRAWLRMVGLRQDVSSALRNWSLVPPDVVEIDSVPWYVDHVHVTRRAHHAASSARYRTLIETAQQNAPPRKINLAFPIPTAFHSGGVNLPFPLPSLVFGSMARQWEAFSGVPLPEHLPDFIEHFLMLNRYDLQTALLNFKQGSKQIGFTGTTTYEIARRNRRLERIAPDEAAHLQDEHHRLAQMTHLLTHFAFYSGVGVKTTAGMGMLFRA
jgi:CRISPR-associated endoribonuclease Cas6